MVSYKGCETEYARVAELADALDSGSSEGNFMGVQVPPLAPKIGKHHLGLADFYFFLLPYSLFTILGADFWEGIGNRE